jgi:hypothetical protein
MQEEQALEFYNRITDGTKSYRTIQLEHASGALLSGVQMHPIDKQTLASAIAAMPSELFDSVEGAQSADEAEEQFENTGASMSAINEETVDAFENIVASSLRHENLTRPQMERISAELNFETLFELGTEIINMSVENTGSVQDFHEQD